MGLMQSLVDLVYPPHCPVCRSAVAEIGGICGPCWRDTPFVVGLVCDLCGAPLPGESSDIVLCDACRSLARPWDRGRTALAYRDTGRRLVLRLKYSDDTELARPAALWMQRSASDLLTPGRIVAPIPLHRMRLLKRRYNQAALLAAELARLARLPMCLDLLLRPKRTPSLKGITLDTRFDTLAGAFEINGKWAAMLDGADLLLVDDVMTSGATLASAAELCRANGAQSIHVVTLARALRDD